MSRCPLVLALPALLLTATLAQPASAQALQPLPGASSTTPPPPPPPPPSVTPPLPGTEPARPFATMPTRPAVAGDVHFAPEGPGLTLLSRSAVVPVESVVVGRYGYGMWTAPGFAPVYNPICTGPCTTRFTPGEYYLALSKDGRTLVPARPVVINGPSIVHASYTDRIGWRLTGTVLGIVGTVGGVVMMVAAVHRHTVCNLSGFCFEQDTTDGGLLAGGVAVVVASAIVGTILLLQHDEAHIAVTPLTLPGVGSLRESPFAALAMQPPQGAALTVRF